MVRTRAGSSTPGSCNENFVVAGSAVFLNDDFSYAELVNAIANRVDGLIDRLLAVRLFLWRLEADRVCVRHFAARLKSNPIL